MTIKLINLAGISWETIAKRPGKNISISGWKLGLLGILMIFSSSVVFAELNWYQIELIVFEQQAENTEVFEQTESAIIWPKNRSQLSPALMPLEAMLQLPVSNTRIQHADFLLKKEYAQLRRKVDYKPLLHIAWLQSVAKNQIGEAVHLYKQTGVNDFIVNGFVRLQRGHYLHLLFDMEYIPKLSNTLNTSEDDEPLIYRLQEKRRIKFNEVHYLDHPKFGVIATVKLIKLVKPVQ